MLCDIFKGEYFDVYLEKKQVLALAVDARQTNAACGLAQQALRKSKQKTYFPRLLAGIESEFYVLQLYHHTLLNADATLRDEAIKLPPKGQYQKPYECRPPE